MDLGVTSLDFILQNYIINDIWKKYSVNISKNLKLKYRLRDEILKKRKVLSSNTVTELELDSFPKDDQYYGLKLNRQNFNNLCADIAIRFENFLIENMKEAEDLGFSTQNFEIQRVGGGSRIPLF